MRRSPRTVLLDRAAEALADAFLGEGPWTRAGLVARGATMLGERPDWLRRVARKVLATHPEAPRDAPRSFARFLAGTKALERATSAPLASREPDPIIHVRRRLPVGLAMGETRWNIASFATTGELAAWLGLSIGELAWFADARGLERLGGDERLRHYRYAWRRKSSGGYRLLEAPKPRLKLLQRKLLDHILSRIPPHDAAHGFRRGRSVLGHAQAHQGKAVVVRLDLEDFFLTLRVARVRAVFREAGYPEEVAHVLASLCTNVPPIGPLLRAPLPPLPSHHDLRARFDAEQRARMRHLPQGAPTSPSLANLCAYQLDRRLSALAATVDATYTRYADDLVFSGDASFARRAAWFTTVVGGIVLDEGFHVNHRKTQRMGQGGRQRVAGLVVNDRARAPRDEYDRLRAILHNCARTGLDAQNREHHPDFRAFLRGRIGWVGEGDPDRAAHLAELFAAIGPRGPTGG